MERKRAMEELLLRIENKNTIKHSLAVEAIMRKLAILFNEYANLWGITGLVHDIDYERVQGDMTQHGIMGADILEALNFDNTIVYAVRAHNPLNNVSRRRKIDKALYCADPMSGLIIACALIVPSKKLEDIDEEFVLKKYHQKGFARGANREQIATCTEIGLTLEEFIKISLEALKEISDELEL
ncbi:MAG: HDIG domain-containing metalloprotein [Acetivibrionales bacterium]|nr:HDIG domain-containing protein [Clostridiaceae bacterium]